MQNYKVHFAGFRSVAGLRQTSVRNLSTRLPLARIQQLCIPAKGLSRTVRKLTRIHTSHYPCITRVKTYASPALYSNSRSNQLPGLPTRIQAQTQGNSGTTISTANMSSEKQKQDDGLEEAAQEMQSIGGGKSEPVSVFPFPNQIGAPCFDGTDVSDCINEWEFTTMEWTELNRIKRVPQYCEKIIDRYLRTSDTFTVATSWDDVKAALLLEFKEGPLDNTQTE